MRGDTPTHPASQPSGVYTICPTPFRDSGELDLASIPALVDFQVAARVSGLAVLGFLGEAHKLSGRERHDIVRAYVKAADGRLPVWVGVRALGLAGAVEQALEAQDLGAAAVFAAPLDDASDAAQAHYYEQLARRLAIPVVIHDFPASFGTELPAELIARLAREGAVAMVKMEEPPVGPKITRIRELAGDSIRIFGGLGGLYFPEELARGAVGTMTGFAYPEVLVRIWEHHRDGNHAAAQATFDRYCPLIRYEFQPKLGLALRKQVYRRRGLIASDAIRPPGMRLDAACVSELESVVARVGLSLDSREPLAIA
jgi:4-hydroxy-tetrahydrodipicolinate synthase